MLIFLWVRVFRNPKTEAVTSIAENFKAMLSPIYLFILGCMALTAISEFGPQQWTSLILSSSGAHPMVILALITGLMAIGRYFGWRYCSSF